MTEGERRLQLWGWVLFVLSALFYVASGIHSGDVLGLLGALTFLLACAFFLVSLLKPH